jgi:DNA invertase Pin-like site-specific DNA recombinase
MAVALLLGGACPLFVAPGASIVRLAAWSHSGGPGSPPPGRGRSGRFPRLPAFSRGEERDRPDIPQSGRARALGYTTFPDRRRAVSPESRYQARRIRAACEARGLVLHKLVGDVQSYSGPDLERPGLMHAMELLEGGEISCLVVAALHSLSRSPANLGSLIERLERAGARLVVIDIDLDTETDEGRTAARTLIRVGALERRQEEGSEPPARRAGGGGGRPAVADLPLLQRRIATMRASGMTLQAIADTLNREGVPTLRGGAKWRPSSVQAATGYRRPSQQPPPGERDPDER